MIHRQDQRRNSNVHERSQLRDERDGPSNASGWSVRVARAPLITSPGCLPRRKSRLYVCKCRVYAMRVGTLMLGYRGCRSHASRWGPYSRAPDPLAHLFSSSLFLSLSTLPTVFSHPFVSVSLRLSFFPSFSICLSFSPCLCFSLVFLISRGPRSLHIWKVEVQSTKRDPNESPWCPSSWAHEKNILRDSLCRRYDPLLETRNARDARNNAPSVSSISDALLSARALFVRGWCNFILSKLTHRLMKISNLFLFLHETCF